MAKIFELMGVALVGAVTLVQQPGVAWAAETTGQGVSASLYGGAGQLEEPNNEGSPALYDARRAGLGLTGVVRFRGAARHDDVGPNEDEGATTPTERDGVSELGGFALLGAGAELEALKRTQCGYLCGGQEPPAEGFQQGSNFAGRFGMGYSFRYVELRGGVLLAIPDADVTIADSLVFPDVSLRLGRRAIGWFELGLGAYDASTNLRPGIYVGGAYGSTATLRVSGHLGVHFPNGLCCRTVPYVGIRPELSVERAVADGVFLALGAAAFGSQTLEVASRLSVLL